MIDLHAHILPALDDGPDSLDESVELALAAVAGGIRTMAATSHVNRSWGLRPADLDGAREALEERLRRDGVPLELVAGGEVSSGRVGDLDEAELRGFALGGGTYVLLECPLWPGGPAIDPLVDDLHERGFRVLLAHPERSPGFHRDPDALARLVGRGALAQLTASSLVGRFGKPARRAALDMLERGLAHVLASDAHDLADRPPDLVVALPALRERYAAPEALFEWMTDAVPAAVLAGADAPPRPAQ